MEAEWLFTLEAKDLRKISGKYDTSKGKIGELMNTQNSLLKTPFTSHKFVNWFDGCIQLKHVLPLKKRIHFLKLGPKWRVFENTKSITASFPSQNVVTSLAYFIKTK